MCDKKTIAYAIVFAAILCVALVLRAPQLELRPVHGDEANQAVKTGILFERGEYRYDPHEHHGPTLYYFALPVLWLSGADAFADTNITHYRLVAALFGLLTILLLWPLRDAIGPGALLWAALFMAVSHAMTYYSRYYIQEMLLVCFTQAALAAGWRLWRNPRMGWALLLGLSLGLVHATKETSALIAMSMVVAAAGVMVMVRVREKRPFAEQLRLLRAAQAPRYAIVVCIAALLVSLTLFSSFFTHLRGPLDSLLTYTHYLSRAEGEGSAAMHEQPWHYYIMLLAYTYRQAGPRWSEALPLALALAGMVSVLLCRAPRHELPEGHARAQCFRFFLLCYACTTLALYTLIPYKTPWNLLVFYHGLLLLAGIGAAALVRLGRWRLVQAVIIVALLAGAAHMARQNRQGNFLYHADTRNPYVYAHPGTPLRRLITRIEDISAVAEEGHDIHINVFLPDGDYWPLPWYLRRHGKVGWWHQLPERADAAIILAAPALNPILAERLQNDYLIEYHGLRPGVLIETYIRRDLWDAFMETRQ